MNQPIRILPHGTKFAITAALGCWRDAGLLMSDYIVAGEAVAEVPAAEVADIVRALVTAEDRAGAGAAR